VTSFGEIILCHDSFSYSELQVGKKRHKGGTGYLSLKEYMTLLFPPTMKAKLLPLFYMQE